MPEYYSPYDLLRRRLEPLDAKFNPSGIGPGMSYGQLLSILADYAPGVGDVKAGVDAIGAAQQGDLLGAGLAGIGVLPMIGSIKKPKVPYDQLKDAVNKPVLYTANVTEGKFKKGPVWASDSPEFASTFASGMYADEGQNIAPVFMNISKPVDMTSVGVKDWLTKPQVADLLGVPKSDLDFFFKSDTNPIQAYRLFENNKFLSFLKKKGYDGVNWKETLSVPETGETQTANTYAAFSPKNVKSAVGYTKLKELLGGN